MKRQLFRKRNLHTSQISFLEPLEDRFALDATAWAQFGGNAQHTSVSPFVSQPLETIHWSSAVDNFPTSRAAHYGGPLITAANTVIYPYKLNNWNAATPDFHIIARNGNDGSLLWDESTDWMPSGYNWYPEYQPVYVPSLNRVYFSGLNGSLYYKGNVDTPSGVPTKVQIYAGVAGNETTTGLTADSAGNIYYAYRNGNSGGVVKVTPGGAVTIALANTFSQDPGFTDWIPQRNHTPAISNDGLTLYTTIRRTGDGNYGRLIGLSTANLTTQYNSGVLKDPRNGNGASITGDSTASPMVAPDGHVFLGVQGNPYNGSRGWMLHFNSDLTNLNLSTPNPTDTYVAGGFGWDTTPSVVPASMVPQYAGTSSYLLFTKYNNYYGTTDGGDGSNGIAVLDPNDTEVEYHASSGGLLVMKRILYKVGPTLDWDMNPLPNPPVEVPTAMREWCINYGAVDPATQSIIVNSADGNFYRWHLPTNTLTEPTRLSDGFGQPYTMTVVGVDGTLYGIQIGRIFALGKKPSISITDMAFSEGTGGTTNATFTVSIDFPRSTAFTVNYATANGTAAAGSDFTSTSGTLTFNPGQKSQTITVAIGTDSLYEQNETFFVNLSGVSSPGGVADATILDAQGLGTINNDDAQPTLTINDVSVNEGNSGTTQLTFTVDMSAPSGLTTTVNFGTANNTATTADNDYQTTSGGLTFTAGQTSKTITVLINGDGTFESNETFFVNLSGAVNATTSDAQGQGTITNDDNVPSLSISDVSVGEAAIATFTVTLSNTSAQTITVNYATANGNATAPADYTAGSGTLTFNPGDTSKSFTVATAGDLLDELNETFVINLTGPVNAFISDNQAIGTILDNDPATTASIGDVSVSEGLSGTTAFSFTVSLSAVSGKNVRVNYATADGTATTANNDYQATSGFITIVAGQTSGTITILVNGDSTNETNETFFVNLTSAIAAFIGDGQGQGTIVNDDGLILSVNDVSLSEGNSSTTSFTFTVTMSSVFGGTVTVDYATANGTATTADSDYAGGSGTLTFTTGQTSKTVTVLVNGDLLNESNETFFVNLSNPVNATLGDGQGQGTINNDDALPSLSVSDANVPEMDYNTGPVTVYVTLSAPSGQTVTVNYDTSNGTASSTILKDYTDTAGSITFLPGQTVASFDVSIFGDTRDEPDETIFTNLSGPVNATISDGSGVITILDDDVVYVTITGTTVTEGNSGQANATVTVDLSIPADYDITIDFTTADGSAIAGSDYVTTSGTLTFAAGVTSRTILVPIKGDLLDEADEDLEVVLSNATPGVVLGVYPETDIDILDNDTAGFLITDVSQAEGNTGTTAFVFTVSLSNPADHAVGVSFATANGTAVSSSDYATNSGVLNFAAGVVSQTVTVLVNGDVTSEPNETFFVNLSSPTGGATINDSQGLGTIVNDEGIVLLTINDVSQYELHTGVHGYTYIATLSAASSQTVTVQFATADGTATVANIDYYATSGTLTFFAGQTTKVITVQIKGDRVGEIDEVFYVNLSNPTNAGIADSQGLGTIVNDDGPPPVPTVFIDDPFANSNVNANRYEFVSPSAPIDLTAGLPAVNRGNRNGVTVQSKQTTESAFADLRFYVLDAGQLKSVAANANANDFAYSIESVVRDPRATIRSRN